MEEGGGTGVRKGTGDKGMGREGKGRERKEGREALR
jgi:hypothetical protein